jgi:hypothetical protein
MGALGVGARLAAPAPAAFLAPLAMLASCKEPPPGPGNCPAGQDEFVSTDPPACAETFCGEPLVDVGTGASGWEAVTAGAALPVNQGPQGGYHVDVAVRTENLCAVVYVDYGIDAVLGDGSRTPVYVAENPRHVQAVRQGGEDGSLQVYWGLRAFIPCEWWPDQDEGGWDCEGEGSAGRIEGQPAVIWAEVWDHNEGRIGEAELEIQPECCNALN